MRCPSCSTSFTKKNMHDSSSTMSPIISAVRKLLNACDPSFKEAGYQNKVPTTAAAIVRPAFKPGDVVHIAPRLWPGINKPGGAAWVLKTENDHEFYDVKYILTGLVDREVPCAYVRAANDLPEERGRRKRKAAPTSLGTSSVASPKNEDTISSDSPCTGASSSSEKKRQPVDTQQSPVDITHLVLLASALDDTQSQALTRFCSLCTRKGGAADIVHQYSEDVTHVVVGADLVRRRPPSSSTGRKRGGPRREQQGFERVIKQRTMKYLQCLLGG